MLFTAMGSRVQSCPRIRAEPSVGTVSPKSIRIAVVLPAPFGPRKPNISPSPISRFRSSTATKSP